MSLHILKVIQGSQLYKKASVCLLLKIIGTISGFLLYLWISRRFGAEGTGIFSLFNILLGLFGIISCLGLTSATMRFVPQLQSSEHPGELNNFKKIVLQLCLACSAFISIALLVFSEYLAVIFFHHSQYQFIIILIAILLPFYSLYLIGNEFLRAFKFTSLFEYFRSTHIQTGGLLLLLILNIVYDSYFLPIYINTALYLCGFIIVWSMIQHYFKYSNYKTEKKSDLNLNSVLKVSFPMLITAFSALLIERIDSLMLAYFHDNHAVGLYTIAFKLASLMMFLIIPFNSVLIPKLSHAFWNRDEKKVKQLLAQGSHFMFWSAITCLLFLLLFSKFLLGLFGNEFVTASTALLFLTIGFFFNAVFGIGEHLLNLTGNQKLLTMIFTGGLVINFILNLLLIPRFGIQGAAFASMSSMVIWNVLVGVLIKQKMQLSILFIPYLSNYPVTKQTHANQP